LRALVTYLNHIDEKDVPDLTVPTGIPLVYHLDERLNCISSRYLVPAEVVKAASVTLPQSLRE
jgi:2,3-bisphosphoglycerate-dependent phosphoglycerate mutase